MEFVAALALRWPLKNDREVTWQNYSFTIPLLAVPLCDPYPEQFYLALSLCYKILDGFFSQKPPPRKATIFSHINPAHQQLLAVSDLRGTQINK